MCVHVDRLGLYVVCVDNVTAPPSLLFCVRTSHVTRHTSHVTRRTSHVTRHTSQTESLRVVGARDHWNNAALLWKIMEYHPDTVSVKQCGGLFVLLFVDCLCYCLCYCLCDC